MHIQRIHEMIEKLTETARCELDKGIECVNTKEFGEVADIIKDLIDAEYKATIVKAMGETEEASERRYYDIYRYANGRYAPKGRGMRKGYEEPYIMTKDMYYDFSPEYWRDLDKADGKMYYTEPMDHMMHDHKEGKSGMSRKMYMDAKEAHKGNTAEDKNAKMKELENYTKELHEDIMEMIEGASNEEKTMLKAKISAMAQKIM